MIRPLRLALINYFITIHLYRLQKQLSTALLQCCPDNKTKSSIIKNKNKKITKTTMVDRPASGKNVSWAHSYLF